MVSFRPIRYGITLVELLVVVGIMLLLLTLVVPRIQPDLDAERIRQGAQLLSSVFTQARLRAMESGRPAAIVFERESPEQANICRRVYLMDEPFLNPYLGSAGIRLAVILVAPYDPTNPETAVVWPTTLNDVIFWALVPAGAIPHDFVAPVDYIDIGGETYEVREIGRGGSPDPAPCNNTFPDGNPDSEFGRLDHPGHGFIDWRNVPVRSQPEDPYRGHYFYPLVLKRLRNVTPDERFPYYTFRAMNWPGTYELYRLHPPHPRVPDPNDPDKTVLLPPFKNIMQLHFGVVNGPPENFVIRRLVRPGRANFGRMFARSFRPIVEFPRGVCIDLSASGFGLFGREFGTRPLQLIRDPAPCAPEPLDVNTDPPIILEVSPEGEITRVSGLYATQSSRPVGPETLFLMVGTIDRVPTPLTVTPNPDDAPVLAEDGLKNWQVITNRWVAVNTITGISNVAPVSGRGQVGGQTVARSIDESREFARQMVSPGRSR